MEPSFESLEMGLEERRRHSATCVCSLWLLMSQGLKPLQIESEKNG